MGGQLKLIKQLFPPKPKWGVDDIPDLTGKVMLVTGACPKLKVKKCAYLCAQRGAQAVMLVLERKQSRCV